MSLKEKILTHAKLSLNAKTANYFFNKTEPVFDQGFKFYLHYYDPATYGGDHPPTKLAVDPLEPPYPKNTFVGHLGNGAAHWIKINKSSFKDGHIVISADSCGPQQGDLLSDVDFSALSQVMLDFGNTGIGYYNSGVQSGCSQLHKHVQYIPHDDHPILDSVLSGNSPYLEYHKPIEWYTHESIKDAYQDLISRMKCGKYADDIKHYNFVLSKHAAFIIPRKLARHPLGITVNSLGVSGHFFLWEKDSDPIKKSPLRVLQKLTYLQ